MLAFPNVFHFFAHELAGLRGRRFAFTLIFARSFNCFFFWHNKMVSPLATPLDVTKKGSYVLYAKQPAVCRDRGNRTTRQARTGSVATCSRSSSD